MDAEWEGGNIRKLSGCFTLVARETLANSIWIKELYSVNIQSEWTQKPTWIFQTEGISYKTVYTGDVSIKGPHRRWWANPEINPHYETTRTLGLEGHWRGGVTRSQKLELCSRNWNQGVRDCLLGAGIRVDTQSVPVMWLEAEERNTLAQLLSLPSSLLLLPPIGPACLHARGEGSLRNVVSCNTVQKKGRAGADLSKKRHIQQAHQTLTNTEHLKFWGLSPEKLLEHKYR